MMVQAIRPALRRFLAREMRLSEVCAVACALAGVLVSMVLL